MKKIIFILFIIILANIYLWRNPLTEESYYGSIDKTHYVIEFSLTNNCSYYATMEDVKYNNCKYSYHENKVTITYRNNGDKFTEIYLLSKDHKTLTLIDNENIYFTKNDSPRIFNDNH